MFYDCVSFVGAVPYSASKTDVTMANPDTGYFTKTDASVTDINADESLAPTEIYNLQGIRMQAPLAAPPPSQPQYERVRLSHWPGRTRCTFAMWKANTIQSSACYHYFCIHTAVGVLLFVAIFGYNVAFGVKLNLDIAPPLCRFEAGQIVVAVSFALSVGDEV